MTERPGDVSIQERRLEGVTFAQELEDYGRDRSRDVSQVPGVSPDYFGEVRIIHISRDGKHAIGLGIDRDNFTLIRDGEPVFSIKAEDVEIVGKNGNFSRIVLGIRKKEGLREVRLIKGEENEELMGGKNLRLLKWSADFRSFLLSATVDERWPRAGFTYFYVVNDESHKVRVPFRVKGVFYPSVLTATKDFLKVVWENRQLRGVEPETSVFQNDRLLAKETGRIAVYASADADRSIVLADDRSKSRLRVIVNGKEIYEAKNACLGHHLSMGDSSLVVFEIRNFRGKGERRLVSVNSEGKKEISDPLEIGELSEKDGSIIATVRRNGVPYRISYRLKK